MDEMDDLARAREAAKAEVRAVAQLAEFADRLSPVVDPAELAEYDNLVGREAAARVNRQNAFERLGLPVPSVEGG
jgi:hypothetical protein